MTHIDNDTLSSVIGDIYECALDRTRWVPTLERLAGLFNACNSLVFSHGQQGIQFGYGWGGSDESIKTYAQTYALIDPMRTMDWHFEVDDPITLQRFMDPEEFQRTTFYRDYLKPLNWLDFVAIILEKSESQTSTVGFTRHRDDGFFGDQEVALLRLLAPHFRRATIFHGIMERDAARIEDLAGALDLIQIPVILCDRSGICVEVNTAAERLLAGTDAIWLNKGTLRAHDRVLDAQIAATTRGAGDLDHIGTQTLSFGFTQNDGRRFAGHVMPLTGGLRDRMGGRRRATSAVFIQTVGDLRPLPGEVLVKLFGLTYAETRLIGLLATNMDLRDAAASLGIALTTARTHLQHIFEKTGTSRQPELMKLVLSALPGAPT